jgi:hypothetical protein
LSSRRVPDFRIWPVSAALTVCLRVRYEGYSRHASDLASGQLMTHRAISAAPFAVVHNRHEMVGLSAHPTQNERRSRFRMRRPPSRLSWLRRGKKPGANCSAALHYEVVGCVETIIAVYQ